MSTHNFKRKKTAAIYRSKTYTKQRAAHIAAFTPGQPCVICNHPIYSTRYVEAQHIPGSEVVLGLCHGTMQPCPTCGKRCNQVDGAQRGRRRRDQQHTTRLTW